LQAELRSVSANAGVGHTARRKNVDASERPDDAQRFIGNRGGFKLCGMLVWPKSRT
jgi:hypothetical protein